MLTAANRTEAIHTLSCPWSSHLGAVLVLHAVTDKQALPKTPPRPQTTAPLTSPHPLYCSSSWSSSPSSRAARLWNITSAPPAPAQTHTDTHNSLRSITHTTCNVRVQHTHTQQIDALP